MPRPILITGSHRSGSTWIGNIISSANNVFYVQEPFNISIKRDNSPCVYWFEYVDGKTDPEKIKFKEYIESFYTFDSKFLLKETLQVHSVKGFLDILKDSKKRSFNRALIKDPIAIMSAEWMYSNLNCDVIVSIRHPAAFVASLKIKGWEFDFNNFLQQDSLMNSYLYDFKTEIKYFSIDKYNIIEQGALLWNIIYSTVINYQKKYENRWVFVKHEDLSSQPINEFEKIFSFLDLEMNEGVKNWINETTNSKSKTGFKRNSKENINAWKNRLNESEIAYIKERTRPVWHHFYTEEDWS
ncbi:MAG: sulfotransferase domain-containing protein [Christiangramia sp.]|uniref:sulfotransferase domain-containing protein n=1 Tax=Christiangramia sp. TaxID=1931228 RepID=UPI00324287B0